MWLGIGGGFVLTAAAVFMVLGLDGNAMSRSQAEAFLPPLVDSKRLDGPVIAEGTLRGEKGQPIEGLVAAYVEPPPDHLSGLAKGESFQLEPLAAARTNADGQFALRVDPSIDLEMIPAFEEGSHRIVNMTIMALSSDGERSAHYGLSRAYDSDLGWFEPELIGDARLQQGATALRPTPLEVDMRPGARKRREEGATAAGDVWTASSCSWIAGTAYAPTWTLVGEINTSSGVAGEFVYSASSTSRLGIAVQAGVSWSASGSMTHSSSATVSYPGAGSNAYQRYDTQFRYREYEYICPGYYEKSVRPYVWVGGARVRHASGPPSATYCTHYPAGSVVNVTQGTAVTWTNGAKMSSQIGLDLSSRTGHTTKAYAKYTFNFDKRLCGSNDYPFQAARLRSK